MAEAVQEYEQKISNDDISKAQLANQVFKLYDDPTFSVLQSIINQQFKDKLEYHVQIMTDLCELFDKMEKMEQLKILEQSSESKNSNLTEVSNFTQISNLTKDSNFMEISKKIVYDKESKKDIALLSALYYDSWKNAERYKNYKTKKEEQKTEQNESKQNESVMMMAVQAPKIEFEPMLLKEFKDNQEKTAPDGIMLAAVKTNTNDTTKENETKYSTDDWWKWFEDVGKEVIMHVIFSKVDYKEYDDINDNVFTIPNEHYHKDDHELHVGIIGDWGSGTEVAMDLLNKLLEHKPDLIIHLGDVYYAGSKDEFEQNYVKPLNEWREKLKHYCPIFSIPGNHDWYGGGKPFYDAVESVNNKYVPEWFKSYNNQKPQTKSFFILKNDHWQLHGMDTGRDDCNPLRMKLTGHYPKLQDSEVKYHVDHFKLAADKRNILLFSHHPLFSAFEKIGNNGFMETYINDKLKGQLGDDNLKNVIAWYWGHEHNFAIYDGHEGLSKGRLLGHSAVPYFHNNESHAPIKNKKCPLLPNNDKPISVQPSKDRVVFNHGYGILKLTKDSAIASYYEIDGAGNTSKETETYHEKLL